MDDAKLERIAVMVEDLHHAIMGNGNGKPGLLTEWQGHKEYHAEERGSLSVWKWIIGSLGGSGLIAGIASLILKKHTGA